MIMIAFLFVSEYCPLSVYFETTLLSVDFISKTAHYVLTTYSVNIAS